MRRLDTPELLDEHDAPAKDVERSLRDLQRFNRYCGGMRVYRKMVRRLLGGDGTVIDLGAGTADLLDSLDAPRPRTGKSACPPLRIAVDWNIRHLLYRRPRAHRVVADARQLPFRSNAADAVTSSHFFHHFSPSENAEILRESLRVARVGVAFTDTRRHIAPLLFTLMLRWLHLVGRITAFDAPASIRRGYTAAEARTITERVGPAVVENHFPLRWVMLLRNAAVPAAGQAASRRPPRTRDASEPAGGDAGVPSVDVAIVGAGPAGSTLAALLAQRGVAVALIDRDAFPRDKLCGEFLSYDALPILDALGVAIAEAPVIERCRVVSRHRTWEFALPHSARGVSRMLLDDLLFRKAVAAGATSITSTATELPNAQVVVGAWGRWGRFDTQLARSFVRDRAHRNFGFKRHYRGTTDTDVIELHSFRRGYLGVAAVEHGITNICGLVHASRLAHHKGRWDSFVDEIRAEEPSLAAMYARYEPAQDGFLSSEPVIFRARSAVEHGVFMVGDASGIVDPLTGNGMAMAIQSALVAAPFILDALRGDRARAEDGYRRRHHEFFARRIHWSRRAAFLLSRPALLDAVLAGVRGPKAGTFLVRRTRADRDAIARLAESWFTRPR